MDDLVDLHTHILPGLDDGPDSMRESAKRAEALQEIGSDTSSRLHTTVCTHGKGWDPIRFIQVYLSLKKLCLERG